MNNKRIIKNEGIQFKGYLSSTTTDSKRLIKQENFFKNKEIINIEPDNQKLHPISSQWINTSKIVNPICLTKFQILNNETKIINNYKCTTNADNYKSFLFLPPIGLTSNDIIKIYDLESIDILYKWISENINNINLSRSNHINYLTIVRVVNCWIRVNFETLKNYNNFLVKIINKLFNFYFRDNLNVPELDKEIKDYINYWMNLNSGTEFKLNLIDDFYNYVIKKFKSQ
jgi:hypothetical protein